KCVVTGNDCLRHCYGMFSMKDTSMAACANAAFQLVAACAALNTLAAVNSEHTGLIRTLVLAGQKVDGDELEIRVELLESP
ncbi:MAG: hypothetical protein WA231_06475, partial [Methylocella sp.]